MPRVADYARHWSPTRIRRFLRTWDDETVDAQDIAERFGLPNGRSAAWLARTLRHRFRLPSRRGAVGMGRFGPVGRYTAHAWWHKGRVAPATIYDAAGRAIAVMDPVTRKRTPIRTHA